VTVYRFELKLKGDVASSIDALFEAGWDDAGISGDDVGGSAEFDREAASAVGAVTSAIEQAEQVGLEVTGVTEDLVTLSEIADRAGRTLAAVDNWVHARRGPGGFPEPRTPRPRAALYSWAEVSAWLSTHNFADIDQADTEVAEACAVIDAALRTRDGLRRLPAAERNQVARLVA
jgi:hypothetical protein